MARWLGVILLLICRHHLLAHELDWTGDATLFGTHANETNPALAMTVHGGRLQGFCLVDSAQWCTKVSSDRGESWSDGFSLAATGTHPLLTSAADITTIYAFVADRASAQKQVYAFSAGQIRWEEARSSIIGGTSGTVFALAMTATSSHVYCGWLERAESSGYLSGWISRSDDHGQSFASPVSVFATPPAGEVTGEAAMAVAVNGAAERLILGATVDRPGSVPEAVMVFSSDDSAQTWTGGVMIDSMAFPQTEVSAAATGSLVLIAYSRRVSAAAARDVFLSYSPDGGTTFSPPLAVTDSYDDDYHPRVAALPGGAEFAVFYLTCDEVHESATMWMRTASLTRPWELSVPELVSAPDGATVRGGMEIAVSLSGVGAVWTTRFALGDTDVLFDASWRGTAADVRPAATEPCFRMGPNYPNPFNGQTVLPVDAGQRGTYSLILFDGMGRRVQTQDVYVSGRQDVALDLSGLPSGVYFARCARQMPVVRLVLVK
jgi:hypothetical protein